MTLFFLLDVFLFELIFREKADSVLGTTNFKNIQHIKDKTVIINLYFRIITKVKHRNLTRHLTRQSTM